MSEIYIPVNLASQADTASPTSFSAISPLGIQDLLLQIFSECCDAAFEEGYSSFLASISRVCRLWHLTVQNSSELWSTAVIPIDRDIRLNGLWNHLQRSHTCSLRIRICQNLSRSEECDFEVERARTAAIMQLLVPHMHRWKKFLVETQYISSLQTIGDMCNGPSPQLEVFTLVCQKQNPESIPVMLVGIQAPPFHNVIPRILRMAHNFTAPQLQRVTLAATRTYQNLLPSFRQTRQLELQFSGTETEGIEPALLLQGLSDYHRLTSLTLRDECCKTSGNSPQPSTILLSGPLQLRLGSLKDLTMCNIPTQYGCFIVQGLIAPLLEHISFVDMQSDSIHAVLKTIGLHQRDFPPFPSLSRLSVENGGLMFDSANLLEHASFCQQLHLKGRIAPIFLQELDGAGTETYVCPRLLSLEIKSTDFPVDVTGLRRLIKNRHTHSQNPMAPALRPRVVPEALQELRVITVAEIPIELKRWFEENVQIFSWMVEH